MKVAEAAMDPPILCATGSLFCGLAIVLCKRSARVLTEHPVAPSGSSERLHLDVPKIM
jgi:hypothetical protein